MSDVTTHLIQDASERKLTVLRVQDCEPIIENNKRLQNEPQASETWRHVASIPNVVLEQWLIEEHNRGNTELTLASEEFTKLIERKLRDRDWLWLRTE
jgi:hypothetical protein